MCTPHPHTGHRECVNSLVGSGADVNAKDKQQYTPLHSAAAGGQAHTAKLLLELGADVSVCVCKGRGGEGEDESSKKS